jgi:hypothetical protein
MNTRDRRKPLLDYIWDAVDQWLEPIGIGKTEFAALAIIVVSVLVATDMIPASVGQWLKDNWQEWVAVATGVSLMGLRHAIRKGF